MKGEQIKGSFLVAMAACCYGILGTMVKLAYAEGFTTAEVTISQFTLGFIGLSILSLTLAPKSKDTIRQFSVKAKLRLIFAGTSLGFTSVFYYMAVKCIPVSFAIVLLMQTVWMSVVLEIILNKKRPTRLTILSVIIVLCGTILSANLLDHATNPDWTGIIYGLLAACSYTATMYSSNNIELRFPAVKRSKYMILGGLLVIVIIFHSSIDSRFTLSIFSTWGLIVSLFGTILPPLLFTKGLPRTGIGLGAVISSLEIPVAVLVAHYLLNEPISMIQVIGILLIIVAVIVSNINKRKTP